MALWLTAYSFLAFFILFVLFFPQFFFHTTSLPSSVRGFLIVSVPFPLLANLISLCFLTLVYCPFNFCGNHTCSSVVVAMPFFSLLPVSFILGFLAVCSAFMLPASCKLLELDATYRMSLIRGICCHGNPLYGVEIQLPALAGGSVPRRFFF